MSQPTIRYDSIATTLNKNTFLVLILLGASFGLGYLNKIIVARYLGAANLGNLVFVLTVVKFITLAILFGSSSSSQQYTPYYAASSKWDYYLGFIKYHIKKLLITAAIVVPLYIAGTVIYQQVSPSDNHEYRTLFLYAIPLLLLFPFVNFAYTQLHNLNKIIIVRLVKGIGVPFIMLLFYASIIVLSIKMTATLIFIMNIIVATFALFAAALLLKKYLPRSLLKLAPKYLNDQWKLASIHQFRLQIIFISFSQINLALLKLLHADPAVVGIFSVVITVSNITGIINSVLSYVITPLISPNYYGNNKERLAYLARYAARLNAAAVLVFGIGILLFGKPILGMFGHEYIAGLSALYIVVLGDFIDASFGIPIEFMIYTGNAKKLFYPAILTFTAILLTNVVLISQFGLIGAALSNFVFSLSGILPFLLTKKYVGIRCFFI